MATGITKTREKSVVMTEMGDRPAFSKFEEWEFDVFHVVADTYSELITAIDEIPDETLSWWSGVWEELGIEGMPNKSGGKWRAMLRTEQIGKGKRIDSQEYHP